MLGPEHLRPLHDGAESPMPPEVGECNYEGQVLLAPVPILVQRDADCQVQFIQQSLLNAPVQQQDERHVNGHVEGQPLAPIPLQTSMEADCQDQFAQQQLLQQGDRHANGHVYVSKQVKCKTVKLYKTKTFTSVVKVALLSYFEELLIRNRAMCLILCLGHIYFVVLVKTAPFFKAEKHRFPLKLLRSFRKNVRHYYSSRFVNCPIFKLKRQFLA